MKIITIQGHDSYDVLGMRTHLILSNGKYYMNVFKCTFTFTIKRVYKVASLRWG